MVHDRANPRLVLFPPLLGLRKARSRRHEATDLNDRTYDRRRYAFVAELRMPAAARSVIFKGSTFSPLALPALNLTRLSEKVDRPNATDVNSRARIAKVKKKKRKSTMYSRTELSRGSERIELLL